MDLPRDPGPFRGASVAAGSLPFGGQRRAELPGHSGEIRFQPADLVPAGDWKGDGVVAVSDRESAPFQAAYPADEAP